MEHLEVIFSSFREIQPAEKHVYRGGEKGELRKEEAKKAAGQPAKQASKDLAKQETKTFQWLRCRLDPGVWVP